MRRWYLLVLIALQGSPVSAEPGSYYPYDISVNPGYTLYALPEDPWPYNAAAGPAGGWGISASSWNPASLVFGRGLSAVTSLPGGGNRNPLGQFGTGWRFNSGWGIGLGVTWVPTDRGSSFSHGYLDAYARTIRRQQMAVRAVIAKRFDRWWGAGLGLRAARTVHLERTLYYNEPYVPPDTGYIEISGEDLSFDLGFRVEHLLPWLTLVSRDRQTADRYDERWPEGVTLAASLTRIKVPLPGVVQDPVRPRDLPSAAAVALAYKPIVTPNFSASFNGTFMYWFSGAPRGEIISGERLVQLGTWGVGAGMELYPAVEAGLGYWNGYSDRAAGLSWFVAYGPEELRLTIAGGPEFLSNWNRYAYLGYTSEGEEQEVRVSVRVQIPLGPAHYKKEDDPRKLPEDYSWWR